jgi:transposase
MIIFFLFATYTSKRERHLMPMRRISMDKVREILRCYEQNGMRQRAIARALNVARPVVKHYLDRLSSAGIDYAAIRAMTDDALVEVVEGNDRSSPERYQVMCQKFAYFAKELKRTGVTLLRLWQEYRDEHPDGYGYSQFCYHFQMWRSTCELTMHLDHKAGDKVFVDFTGDKLSIIDRQTGESREAEVFVAVLAASQLTYVEATATQRKHDWIRANQNALYHFGGVPKAIVPDCLKSAVTHPDKYEPDINPEYADFARHFQTVILPARPNHPKDKPLVEGAVRIVYAWIFAALRNQIFYSLEELNAGIATQLEKYNAKPMQKLKLSRQQLFEQTEKAVLTPLPAERYILRSFKRLKAQLNYHIYLSNDRHNYSVPYRYRGQHLQVVFNDSLVEIFHNNQRIALHKRSYVPNGYTTIKEHMPSHHQAMSDWNPQRFIKWAQEIGSYVQAAVERVLARSQHPEQGYKTCLGILRLAKQVGNDRLNKACQRALTFDACSYKSIKNILQNNLENAQLDCFEALPEHQNLRGNRYYQNGGLV